MTVILVCCVSKLVRMGITAVEFCKTVVSYGKIRWSESHTQSIKETIDTLTEPQKQPMYILEYNSIDFKIIKIMFVIFRVLNMLATFCLGSLFFGFLGTASAQNSVSS